MTEKLKILVVDDEKEFCLNVKDILEMENYEVSTACDGLKGLELIKQGGFALVLMDVKMPVMNGVETFKKMKEIVPDTPVIMVTAYAVEDLLREALQEGAFGILSKPLDFEKLFGLIENALHDGAMILIVDDDEDLCANIKNVLDNIGYRVRVAYNGNTAIEKARENDFDIIILDMKLPFLNGLEVYLAIQEIRRNVVVIIITGYPEEMGEMAQEAVQKGAYICLEKPIAMDGLLSMLEQVTESKSKKEELPHIKDKGSNNEETTFNPHC